MTLLVAKNANGENVPESTKALVQTLFQKALDDADKATKLDPTYAKAYLRKAAAYEELGRKGDARAARASAKRREINAQLENRTPSIPLVEDNVRFTDLASGQDPLDLVSTSLTKVHLGTGANRVTLPMFDGGAMKKFRQRQLRRGKIKLYYALSMQLSVTYLRAIIGLSDFCSAISSGREGEDMMLYYLDLAEDFFSPAVEDSYHRGDLVLATRFYKVCLPLFDQAYEKLKKVITQAGWQTLSSLHTNCGLVHRNASNAEEAIQHFEKGAEYGNGDAMVEVGLIYIYGRVGHAACEQNLAKSKKYLNDALTAPFQPSDYRKNQIREGLNAHMILSVNPNVTMVFPQTSGQQ